MQLLPQTDNLFTVFRDGWHPAETATKEQNLGGSGRGPGDARVQESQERRRLFTSDVDSPGKELHGDQHVTVTLGGQTVEASISLSGRAGRYTRFPLGIFDGDAELTELQIGRQDVCARGYHQRHQQKIPRELGIRVFHAYVDPR